MIIKFTKAMLKPEHYEYVGNHWIESFVQYMIDSKFRKVVGLVSWIKQQVDNPTEELLTAAKEIKSYDDYDEQMIAVQKYVIKLLKYVSDDDNWKMSEKWQTAQETLTQKTGDCEDGAILMYVLARLKGIPASRMFIAAGDVVINKFAETGGHAYLVYQPNQYPLNWVFMDWCYYPETVYIDGRDIAYIKDKHIFTKKNKYKTLWFMFNELNSYKYITPKFR